MNKVITFTLKCSGHTHTYEAHTHAHEHQYSRRPLVTFAHLRLTLAASRCLRLPGDLAIPLAPVMKHSRSHHTPLCGSAVDQLGQADNNHTRETSLGHLSPRPVPWCDRAASRAVNETIYRILKATSLFAEMESDNCRGSISFSQQTSESASRILNFIFLPQVRVGFRQQSFEGPAGVLQVNKKRCSRLAFAAQN